MSPRQISKILAASFRSAALAKSLVLERQTHVETSQKQISFQSIFTNKTGINKVLSANPQKK